MAFNVEYKDTGKFVLAPAGQFQAVACELLDHGHSNNTFKAPDGTENNRPVRNIQFVFQLNKVDPESGKRFEVRSQYLNALTLHEKSGLRKFLTSWRGHDLTDTELQPPGLDLETLLGHNALISVVHVKSGEKTFANIGSIMPIVEGMPEIQPLNYESHQEQVNKAKAQAANGNGQNGQAAAPAPTVDGIDPNLGF